MAKEKITVCVCTCRRTALLTRLFESLARQATNDRFDVDVAVVDNDGGSSETIVRKLCDEHAFPFCFGVEQERNFALVRNRVVKLARGDLLAFIDDDEVPVEDWLLRLHTTMEIYSVDGVLGPVRPYFDQPPPSWIIRGRICERSAHPTGTALEWHQTRTGNVLLRNEIFRKQNVWFDTAFATGGEDVDFFKRAMHAGCRFVWCEEGAAYELVPAERLRRRYLLRRAFIQGGISLKFVAGTGTPQFLSMVLKTTTAAVTYSLLLPFLYLRGEHVFMKYLIKDCHHIGRLAAIFGLHLSRD